MGVSFEQVAINQAEADVAKEKMNSLDTTKATTLKTSLWDLLPPDLEREILELAEGLEILESAEEAAAMCAMVKVVADECQADLDVAMSALNNAAKALDSLTKAYITEVKAYAKPAPAVRITMEGVCIMLDETPDWPTAKKVLGDSQFLNNLKTYDKDNIPEPTITNKSRSSSRSGRRGVRSYGTNSRCIGSSKAARASGG